MTGSGGLSAVPRSCMVCLAVLLTIEAASGHSHEGRIRGCKCGREGIGSVGPSCDTPARAVVPLALSPAWPRALRCHPTWVLWQVEKAWDLLQQRLSQERGL